MNQYDDVKSVFRSEWIKILALFGMNPILDIHNVNFYTESTEKHNAFATSFDF